MTLTDLIFPLYENTIDRYGRLIFVRNISYTHKYDLSYTPLTGTIRYPYHTFLNYRCPNCLWVGYCMCLSLIRPPPYPKIYDRKYTHIVNTRLLSDKYKMYIIEEWPEQPTMIIDTPDKGSLRYPVLYHHQEWMNRNIGWTNAHPGCVSGKCLCLIDEYTSTNLRGIVYNSWNDIRKWDLNGYNIENAIIHEDIDSYASRCHLKYINKYVIRGLNDIYDVGTIELPYIRETMSLFFKRIKNQLLYIK